MVGGSDICCGIWSGRPRVGMAMSLAGTPTKELLDYLTFKQCPRRVNEAYSRVAPEVERDNG